MIKNKLAFISLVILVLYSRRGSTITNPQVWAEDGVVFIPEFLEYGISSLLIPIAGYLAFIPKIITGISLTFPYEYPVVSSTLAWLYTVFVLSIICYAPLILKGRFLCAIGCLMIPSDPEVFGTSIYTLWWSGLLVIIISLWRDNETWIKTRISLLFIAGLSTPISVILSPIFFVRSLIFKRKTDKTILISSIFCSIIQLYFIFINDTGSALNEYNEKKITTIFKKFFGYFILNHDTELNGQLWIISYIFLIFIIVCLIKIKSKFLSFALIYILFINIFLSVYRVNISELHPIFAGPRYFFFPYIIIFWILIQGIYSFKNNILKYLVIIFLSLMLYNSFSSGWSRDHDDLFWAKNLESSKYFDGYNMPIQFDGKESNSWKRFYDNTILSKINSRKSSYHNSEIFLYNSFNLYNFKVSEKLGYINKRNINKIHIQEFFYENLNRTDILRFRFKATDRNNLICKLKCNINNKIIYTTSDKITDITVLITGENLVNKTRLKPSKERTVLDFSSKKLPKNFTIELRGSKSLNKNEWIDIYFTF